MPDSAKEYSEIEWQISPEPIEYEFALAAMEKRAEEVFNGTAPQLIWLLEHPPVYTIGTSGSESERLIDNGIAMHHVGRGGKITYHGPGQRVIYIILDLKKHGKDVRAFVEKVEAWIINALNLLGIKGEIRAGRVGVWVDVVNENKQISEDKIAAIGIRIRKWVSFHGAAINVNPDFSHFAAIVPCGISADEYGVTSIQKLLPQVSMSDLDIALRQSFDDNFNHA